MKNSKSEGRVDRLRKSVAERKWVLSVHFVIFFVMFVILPKYIKYSTYNVCETRWTPLASAAAL